MRTVLFSLSLIAAVPAAYADKLGEHPAFAARRVIKAQGYDYASKFYPHPAWLYLLPEDPAALAARRAEQERMAVLQAAEPALAKR